MYTNSSISATSEVILVVELFRYLQARMTTPSALASCYQKLVCRQEDGHLQAYVKGFCWRYLAQKNSILLFHLTLMGQLIRLFCHYGTFIGNGETVTVIHCSGAVATSRRCREGALFHFSLLLNKDGFHALITVCGGKTGAARTQKEVFFPMRT